MSANDIRKAVQHAMEQVLQRIQAELVDSVVAAIPEPPPPPPAPAPVAAAPAALGGGLDVQALRAGTQSLFGGSGQVEVLNRLMDAIVKHWDRAVLFLIKPGVFQPWDARGFEGGMGNDGAKRVAIAADAATILAVALTGEGGQAENARLDALGAAHGTRAAVLLGIRGKPQAVLYCDGPRSDDDSALLALETLARATVTSIEAGMVSKVVPPLARMEAVRGEAQRQAPVAAVVAQPEEVSTGFAFGGQAEPEPEIEDAPEIEMEMEPEAPPATTWSAPAALVEPPRPSPPPAPVAAPPRVAPPPAPTFAPPTFAPPPPPAPASAAPPAAAEAVPSIPAGTLDPRELLKGGAKPVVDAGQSMQPGKSYSRWKPVRDQMKTADEDPALAGIPEGERAKHVEARKIARLLVSEIKLYNEAKVAVGRKKKNLYDLLKEDIERSRSTYLERIDPDVAAKTNYFRDELVTTLAEGDADALGAGK